MPLIWLVMSVPVLTPEPLTVSAVSSTPTAIADTLSTVLAEVTSQELSWPVAGPALSWYVPVPPAAPDNWLWMAQPLGRALVPSDPESASPACSDPARTAVTVRTVGADEFTLPVTTPPIEAVMAPGVAKAGDSVPSGPTCEPTLVRTDMICSGRTAPILDWTI